MTNKEPVTKYMAFYPSFREVIDRLPTKEKRLAAYDMFTDYGLYGIEPEEDAVGQDLMLIFTVAKPNIKKFNQDLSNGCKGGRPAKNKDEEAKKGDKTPVKTPVKTKKETETEKEKEKETEKDSLFTFLDRNDKLHASAAAECAEPAADLFTLEQITKKVKQNNVQLTEEGVQEFYEQMQDDGWMLYGKPVERKTILRVLREYANKHPEYAPEPEEPAPKTEKSITPSRVMKKAKEHMPKSVIESYLDKGENWIRYAPKYCPKEIWTDMDREFLSCIGAYGDY